MEKKKKKTCDKSSLVEHKVEHKKLQRKNQKGKNQTNWVQVICNVIFYILEFVFLKIHCILGIYKVSNNYFLF